MKVVLIPKNLYGNIMFNLDILTHVSFNFSIKKYEVSLH